MDFSSILFLLTISIITIFLFQSLLKFFCPSNRQKLPLPPGSLGYPYIGETFQLYSENPNVFFAAKRKRYGSIFRTHILGCPCVMISSPEPSKFVLVTRAHLFKPTFPASKERMLGKQAILFHQGDYHSKLRKLVLRAFLPEAIKTIVSDIESIAKDSLQSWEGRLVNTFQEMKTYKFNVALLSTFGKDEVLYREDPKRCYCILEKGYISMPINLPGTLFHKAKQARKELAHILAKILATRRQIKLDHSELLGSFMGNKEGLTDEQIADNIFGVIFAARDTTASVLTWILKYLGENPSVLQALTEEQVPIIRSKEKSGEEKLLASADTKKMPITTRVIQETLNVESIFFNNELNNREPRIGEGEFNTTIGISNEVRTSRTEVDRWWESRITIDLQWSWSECLCHWLRLYIRIMHRVISKKALFNFIIVTFFLIFILASTKSSFVDARVLGSEKTMGVNPDYKGPVTPSCPNPCSILPIKDPRHCDHS